MYCWLEIRLKFEDISSLRYKMKKIYRINRS